MRGTPDHAVWFRRRGGIIPAYAGNTGNLALNLMNWRDHPRVCGEHATVTVPPTDSTGSSPRMRGTHMVILPQICDTGIIPAYAGNTPCRAPAWNWWRDHPRVCGEHYTLRCGMACSLGSSPRMRGTPSDSRNMIEAWGIIPAYAGNTPTRTPPRTVTRDHPRVCGEHL